MAIWGLDILGRVFRGEFDSASEEERRRAADEVIQSCSTAVGAAILQPVPLLDLFVVSPIQIAMVEALGRLYGYRFDKKSLLEIFRTFRASVLTQNAVMAVSKLVPVLGTLASASVAYAVTFALGRAAELYFRRGRQVAPRELRELFHTVFEEKRKERLRALRQAPPAQRPPESP